MKEIFIKRLVAALLKPINASAMILLGVYTFIWGVWLANPLWSVFSTAKLYSQLAQLVPYEWFWGGIAIVVGVMTMYGVIRPSYRSLTIGALALGWHWSMIAIFYFLGDWQNTGGITASIFAIYGGFIWLNLRVNKKRNNWSIQQATEALRIKGE